MRVILLSLLILMIGACQQADNNNSDLPPAKDCEQLLNDPEYLKADQLPKGMKDIPVPNNLNECFSTLDKLLSVKQKELWRCKSEEQIAMQSHFGFGRWIRNNWQLYSNTKLVKDLVKRGILHPDNMSTIILTAYHRKLRDEPLKLETMIAALQKEWIEEGLNLDSLKTSILKKL